MMNGVYIQPTQVRFESNRTPIIYRREGCSDRLHLA
jgi:hypothetical protein